ncbi:hypothetical protein, partial [Escherichia coli]|uniref:hypothetical protein n=1 Tax=Escherichia coli TaxID=562 RepID=UPI002024A103
VLARRPTRPTDFDARMKAVSHFRTLEAAAARAAANKRVSNILAKSYQVLSDRVNAYSLKKPEENKRDTKGLGAWCKADARLLAAGSSGVRRETGEEGGGG